MSPARDRPALGGEHLAAVEPAADRRRRCARRAARPARRRLLVERRPRVDAGVVVGHLRRPDLDEAGVAQAVHAVADDRRLGGQARRAAMVGEHAVDRGEHGRGRAERQVERDAPPGLAGALAMRREGAAHLGELARRRRPGSCRSTASRRRRRTACALARAAPLPEKNSRRQRLDDLPLLGARVLRLVDEDVVDAAVELEHHPARPSSCPPQQEDALGDQVLVVERGAARLGERVALQHGAGEAVQRDRRGRWRAGRGAPRPAP